MATHGRIVKVSKARTSRIDPTTLQPLRTSLFSSAHALESRANLDREDITPANVRSVSSLSLLRLQPRSLRALYERVYRVSSGTAQKPFKFEIEFAEGVGDDSARISRLLDYVAHHKAEIEV